MGYVGTSEGWKPDLVLATRASDSVSIEEQIEREKKRYAAEQAQAAADPTVEVPEPEEPEDDPDDEED